MTSDEFWIHMFIEAQEMRDLLTNNHDVLSAYFYFNQRCIRPDKEGSD